MGRDSNRGDLEHSLFRLIKTGAMVSGSSELLKAMTPDITLASFATFPLDTPTSLLVVISSTVYQYTHNHFMILEPDKYVKIFLYIINWK